MKSFKKTDYTQDLTFSGNKILLVSDSDVIKQNCDSALRQHVNELLFNKSSGIDYFNNIFTSSQNFQLFESQARSQLLSVSGVNSVISFEYIFYDGLLQYETVIDTIYGEKIINGQL